MLSASNSRPRRRLHGATSTRSESSAALRLITLRPATTPSETSFSATAAQGPLRGSSHSTRTGRRLPSTPCRNGSGKEPMTAEGRVGDRAVVLVEPDAVAAVQHELGAGLVGGDAVDEQARAVARRAVAIEDRGEAGRRGQRLALELGDARAPEVTRDREREPVRLGAAGGPQPTSAAAATTASRLPATSANGRAGGGGIARAL